MFSNTETQEVPSLADIVREETDDGRLMVRFLVDAMQGLLKQPKPHHRLSAGKELLRRGFANPAPDNVDSPVAVDDPDTVFDSDPAEIPADPESPEIRVIPGYGNRYKDENGPFGFENYDEADYIRDCYGDYVRVYVLGGREAGIAANSAILDFRSAAWKVANASGQDPKYADHLGTVPDDAPSPKTSTATRSCGAATAPDPAARVAAKGAADYLRKEAALAGDYYPALRPRPKDGPALPIKDRRLYVSSDQPAEDESPEGRSPRPIIERRRRRARGYVDSVTHADDPDEFDDGPLIFFDRFTAPIVPPQ